MKIESERIKRKEILAAHKINMFGMKMQNKETRKGKHCMCYYRSAKAMSQAEPPTRQRTRSSLSLSFARVECKLRFLLEDKLR